MALPSLNPSLARYDNSDLLGLIDLATLTFTLDPRFDSPCYMGMSGNFDNMTLSDAKWYFERMGHEFVIDGDRSRIWSVH